MFRVIRQRMLDSSDSEFPFVFIVLFAGCGYVSLFFIFVGVDVTVSPLVVVFGW